MNESFRPPRLLIVPGLNDSGPAHWQTWLQQQYPDSRRVVQRDFERADLQRWSERIQSTLETAGGDDWIAVAHSFGVLALVDHLSAHIASPIREVLLVAPAEPDRFGLAELLPHHRLAVQSTLVASQNDPWMTFGSAQRWAARWGSNLVNLGRVGHINAESGFGPFPLARNWVEGRREDRNRQVWRLQPSIAH
ncbi:MAG: alpha/beta hydrolase [Paucibacter sp.]|nr:alpha/beta hydrolase [Roseateles sp.]